jgi:hypothetical protein
MLLLTWMSAKAINKFDMRWLEDKEKLITGIGLIILAVVLIIIEGAHLV